MYNLYWKCNIILFKRCLKENSYLKVLNFIIYIKIVLFLFFIIKNLDMLLIYKIN